MNLERFLIYCFLSAPAMLVGLLVWAYVHIGLAIIVIAASLFGAGYAARWIDEAVRREERAQNIMRKWSGPI